MSPIHTGFADAGPLVNKIKASGANMLFAVSYLNDLILIVRTVKQVGFRIPVNGGSGGSWFRLLQECRNPRRGTTGHHTLKPRR